MNFVAILKFLIEQETVLHQQQRSWEGSRKCCYWENKGCAKGMMVFVVDLEGKKKEEKKESFGGDGEEYLLS